MQGGAEFSPDDGNLEHHPGGDVLTRIWFSSGSSLRPDRGNLFLLGEPISLGVHSVRPAVYFLFKGGRVVALGYGIRADLVGTGGWAVGISRRTFCR